jgi:hypothetical protein
MNDISGGKVVGIVFVAIAIVSVLSYMYIHIRRHHLSLGPRFFDVSDDLTDDGFKDDPELSMPQYNPILAIRN